MTLKFNCPNCSNAIIIRYLKPGEKAKCKHCGEEVTVPKTTEPIAGSESEYQECVTKSPFLREPQPVAPGTLRSDFCPQESVSEILRDISPPAKGVRATRQKRAGRYCYRCGKSLSLISNRSEFYCKDCKRDYPEFMRDGVKHLPTKVHALEAFHPGGPVEYSDFYCDREVRIAEIIDCLSEFKLIGILGERGVGKSSTLNILYGLLRGQPELTKRFGHFRWAHRTVLDKPLGTMEQFLQSVTHQLLLVRPTFKRLDSPDILELSFELQALGVKSKIALHTDSEWKNIRGAIQTRLQDDPVACFGLALRLLHLADLRVIILVDEADRFSIQDLRYLGLLIKMFETYKTAFCVAGILDTLEEICAGHASVARVYREFQLRRFSIEETQDLFDRASEWLLSYVEFTPALVQEVAKSSHGIPSIIHNLGYQILSNTIGNDWPRFAEAALKKRFVIDKDALDSVIGTAPSWLSSHVGNLKKLALRDARLVEVLQRIAGRQDYVLWELDAPSALTGIPQGMDLLKVLKQEKDPVFLRTGTRKGPSGGITRYVTFDDPTLGWLLSVSNRSSLVK